jgi:hypothetical protein
MIIFIPMTNGRKLKTIAHDWLALSCPSADASVKDL